MTDDVPPQRLRLGATLRQLRLNAGLSGPQLAEQLGVAQSTISRMERGQSVPSAPVVDGWARVCEVSDEQRAELTALTKAVATEAVAWRRALRRGLPHVQHEIRELEGTLGTLRSYQPVLVPGLLQTPEYALALAKAAFPEGRPDIAEAVQARMNRQTALYDETKRFEFVIAEAVLRWQVGPARVMLAQLDRIATLATLPTVTVGVIPQITMVSVWHDHGFDLFDDRADGEPSVVAVSTLSASLMISDPTDVGRYREAFARLRDIAVLGDDAHALISRVTTDLTGPPRPSA